MTAPLRATATTYPPGTLACLALLAPLSFELCLPALPALSKTLGLSIPAAQATLAMYLAALATAHLLWPWLSAVCGERRALALGAMLLLAGSAASAVGGTAGGTAGGLLAGRMLQGFGLGAVASQLPVLLARGRRSGRQALGAALAPSLAAMAGALLVLYADWRATFWLTAAAATIALMLLALGARQAPRARPAPPQYAHLLGNGEYCRYAASHALCFGASTFFAASAPVLVTRYLGLGVEHIAALLIAGALGLASGTAWGRRGKFKDGPVGMVIAGFFLQVFAAVCLFGFTADEPYPLPLACGFAFLFSLGMGLHATPLIAGALKAAGDDMHAGLALLLCLGHGCAAAAIQLSAPLLAHGEAPVFGATLVLMLLAGSACLPRFIWRAARSNRQ